MPKGVQGFQKGVAANPGGLIKMPKAMRNLCKARTREAIDTLSTLMNDDTQTGAVRVTAANSLLDRAWGRAPQQIDVDIEVKTTFVDVLRRAAEIEKEREATLIDITPDDITTIDE